MKYDVVLSANLPQSDLEGYDQAITVFMNGEFLGGWYGAQYGNPNNPYTVLTKLVDAKHPMEAMYKFKNWQMGIE